MTVPIARAVARRQRGRDAQRRTQGTETMNDAQNGTGELTLYSTAGCHLCEEAEALLASALARGTGRPWVIVDIAEDDALFARYGWHIPVLRRADGEELRWPFDADALRAFLGA
jgi:hypothetical protein